MDVCIKLHLFCSSRNFKLHQEISWSSIYHGYITNGIRFYGYGISKLPYLLYPYIKVSDSGVNASMGLALVIVFILGLLLLVPSLILLLRLFVFDKEYVEGKNNYNNKGVK